jgi:hypothetical protein
VADERSVEPEGIAAARWARRYLSPQSRILVDRANGMLMGSLGDQNPQGGDFLGRSVPAVLTSAEFDGTAYYVLLKDRISYVVVDRRLASALPLVGVYVERDEPGAYDHRHPPSLAALLKFDGVCPIARTFDSGNISIFNTNDLGRAYCFTQTTGPHYYDRFPAGRFDFAGTPLNEREAVERFDRLMQDPAANAAALTALGQEIAFLRDRVAAVAERSNSWNVYWRRWRWQELDDRLL